MVNQLYHTWFRQVSQLWRQEHLPRLRTITWMLIGIYEPLGASASHRRQDSRTRHYAQQDTPPGALFESDGLVGPHLVCSDRPLLAAHGGRDHR